MAADFGAGYCTDRRPGGVDRQCVHRQRLQRADVDAANQAEIIMQQNLANWQNLPAEDQTTANKAVFEANWTTVWNAYVTACNVIIAGDPNGSDAKKALNASIGDRESRRQVRLGRLLLHADRQQCDARGQHARSRICPRSSLRPLCSRPWSSAMAAALQRSRPRR